MKLRALLPTKHGRLVLGPGKRAGSTVLAVAFFAAMTAILVTPAQAVTVSVTATGNVVFNGINDPPLSGVSFGDGVELAFEVDSGDFVDGIPGDTRGYVIDESSFSLTFDTPLTLGLLDPFPGTPFFTLADGIPVADRFWVSDSPFSPGGVALEQEPYNLNLEIGYVGETLDSLDILDALGDYEFDGLTSFGFTLWEISPDFPAMEIDFKKLTIVPEPSSLVLLLLSALGWVLTGRSDGKQI